MENTYKDMVFEATADSAFKYGWLKMKEKFADLLVITIIMLVAQGVSGVVNENGNGNFTNGSISFLIWLVITGPVSYGGMWVILKIVRGNKYEIKEVFSAFGKNYFEILLANLLVTIIVAIGFILFIIPGIVFAAKLAFVPFIVMDKEKSAMDAIKESWKMTTGYAWQIFFIAFLSVFIILGGIILFIIGLFPAVMWVNAALAALYVAVDNKINKTDSTYISEDINVA
jgi:uncharacterized membrane protein